MWMRIYNIFLSLQILMVMRQYNNIRGYETNIQGYLWQKLICDLSIAQNFLNLPNKVKTKYCMKIMHITSWA